MELIKPFSFNTQSEEKIEMNITFSDFLLDSDNNGGVADSVFGSSSSSEWSDSSSSKKRKKKSDDGKFTSPSHMSVEPSTTRNNNNSSTKELSILETNDPYESKYVETNNILRSAINQIDVSMGEINADIQAIRASKVLKKKYDYLAALEGTMGAFLSNKISAARELNNTITKCQDFELKRFKEIRANTALAEQDEDKRVMEMYQAFINTPVSAGIGGSLGPSLFSMTAANSGLGSSPVGNIDAAYAQYHANLTPQQNMMHLESNPDIKQVVLYNQETGARSFEIMNISTGEIIQNAEKHDAMFLEGVTIDIQNRIARNIDLGETYPLVIVGQPLMNEY